MTFKHYIHKEWARHWKPKRTIGLLDYDANKELYSRGEGAASALGGQEGKELFDTFVTDENKIHDTMGQKRRHRTQYKNMSRKKPKTSVMHESAGPATSTSGRRKGRYHSSLGEPYRRVCKKFFLRDVAINTLFKDKEQQVVRIIRGPNFSSNDTDTNDRHTNRIWIKGVEFRWTLKLKEDLTASGLKGPLTVRWCILKPDDNTGQVTDIGNNEFFNSHGTNDDGKDNFNGTGVYTDYLRGINKDKYGVVKHGTFTFGVSTTGDSTVTNWTQQKMFRWYLPINRVFDYTNDGATEPESNMYLVWWYWKRGDLETTKTFGTGDGPLDQLVESTVYHKDVHY